MSLIDDLAALEAEYAGLKEDMRAGAPRTTTAALLKEKQRRMAWLKNRVQKLREQLAQSKQVKRRDAHTRQRRREEIFIDLTRKRVGEAAYNELWAEVDRLEREQWQATWSGHADP